MKLLRYLFIAIAVFIVSDASPAIAEVYLNRQWDTLYQDWRIEALKLIGEGVTLNCDYQNAYGNANKLKPGPPFIIEAGIIIDNIYDDSLNVVEWGGLTIDAQFACSTAFIVSIVDSSADILVYGNLSVMGSTSNPVIFQGYIKFSSLYNGGSYTSYFCTAPH